MFKPHGEWFYKISPPCVFIEFRGCVNKEAFVDFTNKIADEITGNSIKNLHHLIINVKQFDIYHSRLCPSKTKLPKQLALPK